MREELEAVAERWMEEVWRRRDVDAIDEIHAPSFRDEGLKDKAPGPETLRAYKKSVAELFGAFPGFYCTTEDLVVDGTAGKVAVLWSAEATHEGEFVGVAPTGRRVRFEGIEVLRIEEGRIVYRWGEWNGMEILQQLSTVS